ncbi:TPA: acetylornithine transaminase [Listeria innocua]|uniref:Acetylornithine aminotransferase n=1 Tax=Listeria innocua serovar 6a (strain ATCC BAA-680 / CLIP 11262) TaxID=272626 RepID=ARGD_LISIN|nr:acetylornithine transaminase [Listeria innocua]Q92BC0.1 RecName: Full=Acetylornithine aminotransferase; Short=ACOAT [Listeria innocua Clip11262]EAD5765102.1 acetylornithine transaminase [Listeria innocua]EAH4436829.1 acetylornithine transaminase [Listeria innocua]EAH4440801.1 acetylornithine transaminase [Listeria innocua]ECC1682125.1 acetylornithine transaminase [Listeria innocua]ECC1772817.1 acetylornithine transaminase [Listeria innocua]
MKHVFPTYNRFPVDIVKGNGTVVKDATGKTYLDFTSGIAVCNLGHCPENVTEAIQSQLANIWHTSNLYECALQDSVAELITDGTDKLVFFCNSGTEANEAALKLARKYTGKEKIITFEKSFHGRTFGSMSATGQAKIHQGFGRLVPGFTYVPYNDIESFKTELDENTAAVMLEVIQGEGGVIPGNAAWLMEVQMLCKKAGALLIIDEVQTGLGRTGTLFGFQQTFLDPDIFTLAKGLGNGLPIGAMVGKEHLSSAFGPGSHGSTFGGNKLALAAAKEILLTMKQTGFLEEVNAKAAYFRNLLEEHFEQLENVVAIRGEGFLIGIELGSSAAPVVTELRDKGLLILTAGPNILRILPPLTVSYAEIDQAISILKSVLEKQLIGSE